MSFDEDDAAREELDMVEKDNIVQNFEQDELDEEKASVQMPVVFVVTESVGTEKYLLKAFTEQDAAYAMVKRLSADQVAKGAPWDYAVERVIFDSGEATSSEDEDES